jgi:hypothetical protein
MRAWMKEVRWILKHDAEAAVRNADTFPFLA